MIIEVKSIFEKDLKNKPVFVKRETLKIIEGIKLLKSFNEIKNIKKIKGFEDYYRIRIGDYRIGIRFNKEINAIIFVRIEYRSTIYKIFP